MLNLLNYKSSAGGVCKRSCSWKFRNILRKTPVLKAWNFIKKRFQAQVLSAVNIAKFLRKLILKNICERLLLYHGDCRRRMIRPSHASFPDLTITQNMFVIVFPLAIYYVTHSNCCILLQFVKGFKFELFIKFLSVYSLHD